MSPVEKKREKKWGPSGKQPLSFPFAFSFFFPPSFSQPLELWVEMLYYKIDPRKDPGCPADKVYWSALHCGVETLLSGGTAIMDHL